MFLLNELHQYSEEWTGWRMEGVISRDEALNHPAIFDLCPDGKEIF